MEAAEQITLFKIVAGLPQTKGGTKLKNLEGAAPKSWLSVSISALHATGLHNNKCLLTVYHPCRVEQVSDVVLSCCIAKGIAPKGDIQIFFGHSKSDIITWFVFLMSLLWCLVAKRQISCMFPLLYYTFFRHAHAHGVL